MFGKDKNSETDRKDACIVLKLYLKNINILLIYLFLYPLHGQRKNILGSCIIDEDGYLLLVWADEDLRI
jgi:hypothetical protein